MSDLTHDEALARLEDELRSSRTQAWDVEEFLARRHKAKIDALTSPSRTTWARRLEAVKEAFWGLMALFGFFMLHLVVGVWLLTGDFPIHGHSTAEDDALRLVREGVPVPPPAPPVTRLSEQAGPP